MKIFYFAHFGDWSGYGKTARDYVELLETMGHNVYCRSIDYPENVQNYSQKWVDRCKKELPNKFDIFIIHKAPWNQENAREKIHEMSQFKQADKHIYFTVFETSLWPAQWKDNLKHFDQIVTFSQWQKQAAINLMGALWEDKIHVCHHIVKTEKKRLNIEETPDKPFQFYAEFSKISHRKGLDILLSAYFQEFKKSDNVILKIKIPARKADVERFDEILKNTQDCFRYKETEWPKIKLCRSYLTDKQMDAIMSDCDVFVNTSRGEGFCLPLALATLKGIPCIFPIYSQFRTFENGEKSSKSWGQDYNNDIFALSCNAELTPIITNDFWTHGMRIDTLDMNWIEPNINHLAEKMRFAQVQNNIYDKTLYQKQIEYAESKLSEPVISAILTDILKS